MEPNVTEQTQEMKKDSIASVLMNISRYAFLIPLGIAPIIFFPGVNTIFEYTKVLPIIVTTLAALIFFSLATLRSGELSVPKSWTLIALWGISISAIVSALLSGDVYDSLIGDMMATQTALFLFLLASVASAIGLLCNKKEFVMKLYILLIGSALVLGVFHIVRLIFGTSVLQFGIFNTQTNSLLGNWNDIALFYGLCIIVSLVVLEQLPLTKWGRILFGVVTTISLCMLSVINFFAVWLVLALVSLLVLMYTLVKDRFQIQPSFSGTESSTTSLTSILISAFVFVVSMIFLVGGSLVGSFVNNVTNVSYVEVRPAALSTIDVAKNVYQENALFGVGPNRFADAWRLHKDPNINTTLFWNADFSSGYSFMLTQVVTNGIVGVVLWVAFLMLFILNGFRTLFSGNASDKVMRFIFVSSFTAAMYLWGMTFIYNPGAILMILTAVFTGIAIMASAKMQHRYVTVLSVFNHRAGAMFLIGVVMISIVGSSMMLYFSAQHYAAVYTYAKVLQSENTATDITEVEQILNNAISLVNSDTYVGRMAQYQLLKMQALVGIEEPTTEQQQQFEQASAIGLQNAQAAVALDRTNPTNWLTLARIYGVLALVGVDNAGNLATQAFTQARELAPHDPSYSLLEAQFLAQIGEIDGAREKVAESISLKSNYTEALYFLAQLEVQAGNTEEAIVAAESMVSLEPQNAARLYQLGILYLSADKIDEASVAFERAVTLDGRFSNARYFLALTYVEQGKDDQAIAQLEKVLELNPDNEQVTALIEQISSGNTGSVIEASEPLTETESDTEEDSVVTTDTEPDTDLVSTVNTVPANDEDTGEAQ